MFVVSDLEAKCLHNLPVYAGKKVCLQSCNGKSIVGLNQLCLSNMTFMFSLEKQLSACGRNV